MLASRFIPLTSSFRPPLHLFRQVSSMFSPPNRMGKIVNSSTESSAAAANSDVRKNIVMADEPLVDTSHDNKISIMMIGSIPISMDQNRVKNFSLSLSPSCTSSADKHTKLMPKSNHLNSLMTSTTGFQDRRFKMRSRVDLGSAHNSGDNSSSNCEDLGSPLTETLSTRRHDELPQGSHSWKRKDTSVNRPYNRHSYSNYEAAPHKFDSPVIVPKFKPYDICFRGRRNSGLIGATSPGENGDHCIEMHEGGAKEGVLRPGMVLLKHYLTHDEQVQIVKTCRELGLGPGGFYQPSYAGGAKLRLKMMCLGMDWDPQTRKYGKKRVIDGSKPPSIPNHFNELVIRATQEAHNLINKEHRIGNVEDIVPPMTPDLCIVNFYTTNGRLGLHQDRDESRESLQKGLPVVSFSIGDSAEFLYGDQRDVDKAEKVILESGDVLIFGGESRHVFHGVSSVFPDSAPKELLEDTWLCPGRLNLTFRKY